MCGPKSVYKNILLCHTHHNMHIQAFALESTTTLHFWFSKHSDLKYVASSFSACSIFYQICNEITITTAVCFINITTSFHFIKNLLRFISPSNNEIEVRRMVNFAVFKLAVYFQAGGSYIGICERTQGQFRFPDPRSYLLGFTIEGVRSTWDRTYFLMLVRSADPADRCFCDRRTDGRTDELKVFWACYSILRPRTANGSVFFENWS